MDQNGQFARDEGIKSVQNNQRRGKIYVYTFQIENKPNKRLVEPLR